MQASGRALFTGIIDYAGMFPPAQLPLSHAIRDYARYRREAASWLLGRFVCPAPRLLELAAFADEMFPADSPLAVIVLGSDDTERDNQDIDGVRERYPGRLVMSGYERKWNGQEPLPVVAELNDVSSHLEVALAESWRATLAAAVRQLAGREPAIGLKIRCGSDKATAVPSTEQLAGAIAACRDAGIPLKFTAGLHHALRHAEPLQHGFLNLFAAGVLAHACHLDEPAIHRIVEENDAAAFEFTDRLAWRGAWADAAQIAAARRLVTSFGSCSFDEPVADLRKLRLID